MSSPADRSSRHSVVAKSADLCALGPKGLQHLRLLAALARGLDTYTNLGSHGFIRQNPVWVYSRLRGPVAPVASKQADQYPTGRIVVYYPWLNLL